MASRIQGITVEIGGDTTKLSTALSKVNKEIRDTQSQLKDVNKLLKLDPGNTDLMAQKQKLLTQAISETKEKLDALKMTGQQANEALAKGEISQSQYDALQREIVETEKALEELEKQADKSAVALQKIGATGEKLKNVGSSIEGVGKKLMPVMAAVGAIGTIMTAIPKIAGAISGVVGFVSGTVIPAITAVVAAIGWVPIAIAAVIAAWNAIGTFLKNLWSGIVQTGKTVFQGLSSFLLPAGRASSTFRWGADLINGIVNGIRSAIGNVVSVVSDVANAIRSRLHFSVPDEGPLTDYESWMPDFMKGLAQGIEKSKGMVKQAVEGVAADMVISPKVSAMETAQMQVSSMDSIRQMVSGIQEMFSGMQDNDNMGTICIPVYIGGKLLDEVVVNAQARQNLRSGGR